MKSRLGVIQWFFYLSAAGALASEGKVSDVMEVTGFVIKGPGYVSKSQQLLLTREEIEAKGAESVVEVIRNLPGVNITQQGGVGGLSFVSLRGGDPNFTSVIIDGVRVNDPTNSRGGGFDFAAIDIHLVESISIHFGGFSAVYGSEALGGILSIKTLSAENEQLISMGLEVGSEQAHAESFHLTGPATERLNYSVSGSNRSGGNTVKGNSLEREQINLKLNNQGDVSKFVWSVALYEAKGKATAFPEDSGGDKFAINREIAKREFEQLNMGLVLNVELSKRWQAGLSAGKSRHEEDSLNPWIAEGELQGVPAVYSESLYERTDFNFTNTIHFSKYAVGIGYEATREHGQLNSLIDLGFLLPADFSLTRGVDAYFIELSANISNRLRITTGLRYDRSDESTETTSRLLISYEPEQFFNAISFHYGEGFKLPSFFALGHPLIGNINLKPEHSENLAVEIDKELFNGSVKLVMSLFKNRYKDLVDFDPVSFSSINRSEFDVHGVEFRTSAEPSTLIALDGYVTYSKYSHQKEYGRLRRRPDWRAGVTVNWKINESLNAVLNFYRQDGFYDSSIPTGMIKMDGYQKVDLSFGYRFSKKLGLKFVIDNITNSSYEETVGFSNSGQTIRLVLSGEI
ncbi:MAG: TonB-dependent receptor [Pseudomonadales bacterium]|nr:TonB-dependent receptor [Pseudomonadales bacterium]